MEDTRFHKDETVFLNGILMRMDHKKNLVAVIQKKIHQDDHSEVLKHFCESLKIYCCHDFNRVYKMLILIRNEKDNGSINSNESLIKKEEFQEFYFNVIQMTVDRCHLVKSKDKKKIHKFSDASIGNLKYVVFEIIVDNLEIIEANFGFVCANAEDIGKIIIFNNHKVTN